MHANYKFFTINWAESKETSFYIAFSIAILSPHPLLRDKEIVSGTDEEKDNIPQPTTWEVEIMLLDVRWCYQSKSDLTNKVLERVIKSENDALKRFLVPISQRKVT